MGSGKTFITLKALTASAEEDPDAEEEDVDDVEDGANLDRDREDVSAPDEEEDPRIAGDEETGEAL